MKYSVEEILSNGAAVLVSDDGKKLAAERGRFDSEPVEGMLCELGWTSTLSRLWDNYIQKEKQSERQKTAAGEP